MHNEAKQTEISEFGAEKVYNRAEQEQVACARKTPNADGF